MDNTLQDKNSTESSAVKINPKILADAFRGGDGGDSEVKCLSACWRGSRDTRRTTVGERQEIWREVSVL